jgi:hypothetical protein
MVRRSPLGGRSLPLFGQKKPTRGVREKRVRPGDRGGRLHSVVNLIPTFHAAPWWATH